MKKWIIASCICLFPFFLLGIGLPIHFLLRDGKLSTPEIICVTCLITCLSVILTTLLFLSRYSGVIDRIEKKEQEINESNNELHALIRKYNRLILEAESKN